MNFSIITTIFLLISVTVLGQVEGITEIRKLYKETQDNKSTYRTLSGEDFEYSSEGGELKAFKDSDEVRLIEATYYGHMGKTEAEFYYKNGEPYFIFLKRMSYNRPVTEAGFDHNKTEVEESRYYFWNNKMIRWIRPSGAHVEAESPEFLETSKEIYEWAIELLRKLK